MASSKDESSAWNTVLCKLHSFTVPQRYRNLVLVGQGAYGAVVRATDTEIGKYVAIKKMLHPFESSEHAKRTYRELKLLMYLNHPDSQVVQLYNVFTPNKSLDEFQTVYLVMNFANHDLGRIVAARKRLDEMNIRSIVYSLLRGLKFIHSSGIIHRDLKPCNIGIDEDNNVSILDFGLACLESSGRHTAYVSTRWWRAPEVYLNERNYNEKIDLWSVGCIMAELILLKPICQGCDTMDQLNKIFDVIGTPSLELLNQLCEPDVSGLVSKMKPRAKIDFHEIFGYKRSVRTNRTISGVSPEGVDLLDRLLNFDPRQRPTAEEALAHPFLEALHEPTEEPTIEAMVDEHQNAQYTTQQWKSIIWQLIQEFKPPSWITDDSMEVADD